MAKKVQNRFLPDLRMSYQCGTQFGSHEWKVDPIWFTSIFKKTFTKINLIFGRKVVWVCRNLLQLLDFKSVHPSARKGKRNNTMGNDCLEHDVNSPSSTRNINKTGGLQHFTWKCPIFGYPSSTVSNMNTPKKRKQFTREQLRDAIFAVNDGASKRDVARKFGIPLTTLIRWLRNRFPSPVGWRWGFHAKWGSLILWNRDHWRHVSGSRFPLYSCSSSFLCLGKPI